MKRMDHKKQSVGKVFTGMLIGSIVGAAVAWLSAPAFGAELRLSANRRSLQEKIKTSDGNVESRARELAEEVAEEARDIKTTVFNYRNPPST